MNPFQSQLLFQDGETLSEKAARHHTGVNPPLPAQKVTVEEFESIRNTCACVDRSAVGCWCIRYNIDPMDYTGLDGPCLCNCHDGCDDDEE